MIKDGQMLGWEVSMPWDGQLKSLRRRPRAGEGLPDKQVLGGLFPLFVPVFRSPFSLAGIRVFLEAGRTRRWGIFSLHVATGNSPGAIFLSGPPRWEDLPARLTRVGGHDGNGGADRRREYVRHDGRMVPASRPAGQGAVLVVGPSACRVPRVRDGSERGLPYGLAEAGSVYLTGRVRTHQEAKVRAALDHGKSNKPRCLA